MQVSDEMLNELRNRNIFRNLNVFFASINMDYAVVKGEALSIQAYGSAGKRNSSDIDILVSRKDINKFEKILNQNGFSKIPVPRRNSLFVLTNSHQTVPWVKDIKPWGRVVIDLNFDIFWGEYEGHRINIDEFVSDAIEINIYGVKVKTLRPLKAMVQLILHHYKDLNSLFLLATRKSIKCEMFKDVYYLLKNNLEAISLNKLYTISAEYEIVPYVYYILYHTGQLFNDRILQKYIDVFKTPEGKMLLNCYGLNESERREWRFDFKTRLESDNLYDLIKDDLNERDEKTIEINKRVFLGMTE